jgi:hypothetical protein
MIRYIASARTVRLGVQWTVTTHLANYYSCELMETLIAGVQRAVGKLPPLGLAGAQVKRAARIVMSIIYY